MGRYTASGLPVVFDSPAGKDELLVREFTGHEAISELFHFSIGLNSDINNAPVALETMVGKSATLSFKLKDEGSWRHVNGYIRRFCQESQSDTFTFYRAELVPWPWFLTKDADCRIFQNLTIPKIIEKVFKTAGFSDFRMAVTGSYEPREYCVQYRETDFAFVSRLMEDYGIFYFFEHEEGKHTMVLSDSKDVHQPCPVQNVVEFDRSSRGTGEDDVITALRVDRTFVTGKASLNDFDFKQPSKPLLTTEAGSSDVGEEAGHEVYDYPGEYVAKGLGQKLCKVRTQEYATSSLMLQGESSCRSLVPGLSFKLRGHFNDGVNANYLVSSVEHFLEQAHDPTGHGTVGSGGTNYANTFSAIPATTLFRAARVTPKPIVYGSQTATVVGKKGDEIFVDEYGRVKVQFHWDREGKRDENASCYIRVSQIFAGSGWGAMFIPRIGQEVIVDFLEGNPDCPIIVGRVYNGEQKVPYPLPAEQTKSVIKTHSTKNGGPDNYNEVRFEDKKGEEELHIQAEKDYTVLVKNDRTTEIKRDKTEKVKRDRTTTIERHETLTVKGNRTTTIEGEITEEFKKNRTTKITMKDTEEALEISLTGKVKITLTVGGSSITLTPAMIEIKAPLVKIN